MSDSKLDNFKKGALPTWYPEDFGFTCVRRATILEANIWRNGVYELRCQGNNIWLCRKNTTIKGEPAVVVNFRKEIRPEDSDFARMLLLDRLT